MAASKVDRCKTCGRKQTRSHQANARLWLLYHLGAEKLRPGGKQYSAEQLHWYYKSRFLGCQDIPMPNGKTLLIPNSTANLDTAEFNDYMTKVEADLSERGIFLDSLETT